MNDKTRNLLIRTASGTILLGIVLLATLTNSIAIYSLFALGITVGALLEFYALCRKAGYSPNRILGVAIAVLIVAWSICSVMAQSHTIGESYVIIAAIVILAVMVFVSELWRKDERPMASVSTTLAGVIYTAAPVAAMTFFGGMDIEWNGELILAYMLIVWANDVFAYLFGITLGRHKMCPSISPKKSWEGFVGGIVMACVVSVLNGMFWLKGMPIGFMAVLGIVVALSGVAGDLVESQFKRSVGVKDSGAIMPGHGGVLDRFDALFLSAPMAVACAILYNLFFM